ncbi:MAG: hypothetical protein RCG15_03980 [Candidatus Rickettsia vulgarisii]
MEGINNNLEEINKELKLLHSRIMTMSGYIIAMRSESVRDLKITRRFKNCNKVFL